MHIYAIGLLNNDLLPGYSISSINQIYKILNALEYIPTYSRNRWYPSVIMKNCNNLLLFNQFGWIKKVKKQTAVILIEQKFLRTLTIFPNTILK